MKRIQIAIWSKDDNNIHQLFCFGKMSEEFQRIPFKKSVFEIVATFGNKIQQI